jgi:hypothetical protein
VGAAPRSLIFSFALCQATLGCRDIDRFDTEGSAAYCGSIVGAASFHKGFIETGAPPSLNLRLHIDTDALTTTPGVVTSDDRDSGLCSAEGAPLFDEAPLRAIDEVLKDAISHAEFGDGHEHDLFAWVDSKCQGTMLAVMSLLTSGAVEVRLFKPAKSVAAEAPQAQQAGFALFYLTRSERGCEF